MHQASNVVILVFVSLLVFLQSKARNNTTAAVDHFETMIVASCVVGLLDPTAFHALPLTAVSVIVVGYTDEIKGDRFYCRLNYAIH